SVGCCLSPQSLPPRRSSDLVGVDESTSRPLPGETGREAVRATLELASIADGVLHVMFPGSVMYRSGEDPVSLMLEPAPGADDLRRLKDKLFALVARAERRSEHVIAREEDDRPGTRLEVMTPVAPSEYQGGARIVGTFADMQAAESWGGDNAVSTLSFDTFYTGQVWLVDLFDLPAQQPHGIS